MKPHSKPVPVVPLDIPAIYERATGHPMPVKKVAFIPDLPKNLAKS